MLHFRHLELERERKTGGFHREAGPISGKKRGNKRPLPKLTEILFLSGNHAISNHRGKEGGVLTRFGKG